MAYWQDRMQAAQNALTAKKRREVERQLKRYYSKLSKKVIEEYENLYNQVLLKKAAGETISPATLYQMDKYWSMQGQLRQRLQSMGEYFQSTLGKIFEIVYKSSYNAININGLDALRTLDEGAMEQVLNQIWTSDGKSCSQRIWNDMTLLQETLEEGLLEAVTTGKKTSDLKKLLQQLR